MHSLGYFKASDSIRVESVEAGSDGASYVITVAVTDENFAQIEYQINGVNLITAEVTDGMSRVEVPAEWFTDGMDMIHVRALDANGEYLHIKEEPEAATVGNYFLYE